MDKLNLTPKTRFKVSAAPANQKLTATEYNTVTDKIDEIVDEVSPETISTLTNPLVFAENERVVITPTSNIDLTLAGNGHGTGFITKKILFNSSSFTVSLTVPNLVINGDALDGTKNNYLELEFYNGNIIKAYNQVFGESVVPTFAPLVFTNGSTFVGQSVTAQSY